MLCVGNDIVDLSSEDASGKQNDIRFLKKILNAEESKDFNEASDKFRALWQLWTAKETGYKIGKKLNADLVFSPKKFKVSLTSGHVAWEENLVYVRWEKRADYLYCIGTNANTPEGIERCVSQIAFYDPLPEDAEAQAGRGDFSDREQESIFSGESAAVRKLAKSLLSESGLTNVEIVRPPLKDRFGPPQVFANGCLSSYDLSLSHHGRYVAAAFIKK